MVTASQGPIEDNGNQWILNFCYSSYSSTEKGSGHTFPLVARGLPLFGYTTSLACEGSEATTQ